VGHDLTADGRLLLKKGDESVDRRLSEIASILADTRPDAKGPDAKGPDAKGPDAKGPDGTQHDAFKGLECWKIALDAHRTGKHVEQAKQAGQSEKVEQKVATK